MIGSTELIVIALVILVLFGSSAIPKFARSLGRAKAELEKGISEGEQAGSEKEQIEVKK